MGLYEGIKDVANIIQQADNIDLYRKLLDLSAEAQEMQAKIQKLTEENEKLKEDKKINEDIVYYPDPYITRKSDVKHIRYCAACWGDKGKIIPLQRNGDNERERYMMCPLCKTYITKISDDEDEKYSW